MAAASAATNGEGVLVLSPHLDDAVLSCGCWLAAAPGAVVVTVFAGHPADPSTLTPWDRACGFASGDAVVARRREEDRHALALVGARPVWLDFLDAQYGPSPDVATLAAALAATLDTEHPERVAFPLGLFHSDHVLVSDAVLRVAELRSEIDWIAYEDALYRSIDDASAGRRRALEDAGWRFAAAPAPDSPHATARKRAALDCYPSQLRGLATPGRPDVRDALAPERYLRIDARPATAHARLVAGKDARRADARQAARGPRGAPGPQ